MKCVFASVIESLLNEHANCTPHTLGVRLGGCCFSKMQTTREQFI